MHIWLPLSVFTCAIALLNASMDVSYRSKATGNLSANNKLSSTAPMELNINFTFPANGLPPLKVNLGNIAEFLTESDATSQYSQVSSGIPIKKTVIVNIKNPNKPLIPIPSAVFTAALPQGFQIPVNTLKNCHDFVISRCKGLCSVARNLCRSTCNGQKDCLKICSTTRSSCTKFCSSMFNKDQTSITKHSGEQAKKALLPKCLRNCRYNKACMSGCYDVCDVKLLAPAPLTDVLSTVPISLLNGFPNAGKPSTQDLLTDVEEANDFGITNEKKDEVMNGP